MPKECIDFGFAATKCDVGFHDVTAATDLEYFATEPACRISIKDPRVLKSAESIGSQYLGPFIAVIAGAVTASKDM